MTSPGPVPRILAIDTATEACSAALGVEGRVHLRFENIGRGHTQRILPMVDEVLREAGVGVADCDAFACGVGPGSFTGVRIAVGIVKGLAVATGKPVVGVSSLAMLAQAAFDRGETRPYIAAIDARMGEVYWAGFERDDQGLLQLMAAPRVCPPQEAPLPPGEVAGGGTGFAAAGGLLRTRYGASLRHCDDAALPSADSALRLAAAALRSGQGVGDAESLEPLYLRNKVALTSAEQAALRIARAKPAR